MHQLQDRVPRQESRRPSIRTCAAQTSLNKRELSNAGEFPKEGEVIVAAGTTGSIDDMNRPVRHRSIVAGSGDLFWDPEETDLPSGHEGHTLTQIIAGTGIPKCKMFSLNTKPQWYQHINARAGDAGSGSKD